MTSEPEITKSEGSTQMILATRYSLLAARFRARAKELALARAKGQTLVFVGLLVAFGVLMGFVALAADGGSALLQRRNMQNGADAAALGAVQSLAASVVLSSGVGLYTMSNRDLAARVDQAV